MQKNWRESTHNTIEKPTREACLLNIFIALYGWSPIYNTIMCATI